MNWFIWYMYVSKYMIWFGIWLYSKEFWMLGKRVCYLKFNFLEDVYMYKWLFEYYIFLRC